MRKKVLTKIFQHLTLFLTKKFICLLASQHLAIQPGLLKEAAMSNGKTTVTVDTIRRVNDKMMEKGMWKSNTKVYYSTFLKRDLPTPYLYAETINEIWKRSRERREKA